jgi:polyhydroxybutyrate depolymerase
MMMIATTTMMMMMMMMMMATMMMMMMMTTAMVVPPGRGQECNSDALPPGDHRFDIVSGGFPRTFLVHIPPNGTPSPLPLLFDNHGGGLTGDSHNLMSKFREKSDIDSAFVVVQPDGYQRQWNCGCLSCGANQTADDMLFFLDMIDFVRNVSCIDPRRIYATGFSVGGFISHRLGWELSDVFAAVAPHSGMLCDEYTSIVQPVRAIPTFHVHGNADFIVPYEGQGIFFPSAPESHRQWAEANGCSTEATTTTWTGTPFDSDCQTYTGCDGQSIVSTLCTLDQHGHTWKDGDLQTPAGEGGEFASTAMIWAFLSQYSLPE